MSSPAKTPPLPIRRLRSLNLKPAPDGPAFLSAASGLVLVHSHLYVIADDELELGVFPATGTRRGHLHRLLDGVLPAKKKARKKHKPDLEALALLPPTPKHRHGALLILGSGSKDNRRRAVLQGLGEKGELSGAPQMLDLAPLYRPLEEKLEKLNIEGATVRGNELLLFQRGNKTGVNAVIRAPLRQAMRALATGKGRIAFKIARHDLGKIDGVPLSFTDAAALPGGDIVFTAAAEDTENSYDDGPCRGSAIGLLDKAGRLAWLRPLRGRIKIEGVQARRAGATLELLLVSDADDPAVPAGLYRARVAVT